MIDFTQFPDYEFTKEGQVISHRKNTKVLRPGYLRGYQHLPLYDVNGKQHTFQVHRLILEWFCPTDDPTLEVDHINHIKDDNRLENLRWVSHQENMENIGKYGPGRPKKGEVRMKEENKWTYAKYDHRIARLDYYTEEVLEVYKSLVEAESKTGLSRSTISQCLTGKTKSAGHYKWKRLSENN